MGGEADCDVRLNEQTSKGRARLGEKELLFRGDFRLKIRFGDVKSIVVKPGMKVSLLGIDDDRFKKQLETRTDDVTEGRVAKGSDIVFVKMTEAKEAARLKSLKAAIKPDGAVWLVWPKGQKAFREDDARTAWPAAGLVDVKVASFSETLSALKMVIPVKDRPVLR